MSLSSSRSATSETGTGPRRRSTNCIHKNSKITHGISPNCPESRFFV